MVGVEGGGGLLRAGVGVERCTVSHGLDAHRVSSSPPGAGGDGVARAEGPAGGISGGGRGRSGAEQRTGADGPQRQLFGMWVSVPVARRSPLALGRLT